MSGSGDRGTDPRTSRSGEDQFREEVRVVRRQLQRRLPLLTGTPQERARIEDELAHLLRDEAESAGVDLDDSTSVDRFLAARSELLERLALDLQREIGRDTENRDVDTRPSRRAKLPVRLLDALFADLRMAMRALRRRPGMTAVILLTLVLAIGLNSATFSVLDSAVLRPAAVADSSELVKVYSSIPDGFLPEEPMSLPDILDVRTSGAVEDIAAQAMTFCALSRDGAPAEIIIVEMVSDNLFTLLGVEPRLGRLFRSGGGAGERALFGNEGQVAVLSESSWRRRYDADPAILGKVIRLNGHPLEVVGVVPHGYQGLARGVPPEVWVPLDTGLRLGLSPSTNSGQRTADSLLEDRGRRSMWTVARMPSASSVETLDARLQALASSLASEHPDTNRERTFDAVAFDAVKVLPTFDAGIDTAVGVLLGVMFLVLLIASTNLASLLLVRAIARRGEMATRLSLGAGRGTIVRQLLVESLLLAVAGAAGGLALAFVVSRVVSNLQVQLMVPLRVDVTLDQRVVIFTLLLTCVTVVFFGLAPAFEASRTSLLEALNQTARRGNRKLRAQNVMVVAQVAFSVVLLVFAALAVRSVLQAAKIDIGMDREGVAGLVLSPSSQGYDEAESASFYQRLRRDLETKPEITGVSLASHLPLGLSIDTADVVPAHRRGEDPDDWPEIDTASVDETFFELLRIPLLRGRVFTLADREEDRRVVVVNRKMAETFWGDGDPIGQQLFTLGSDDPHRVIGVVGNGKYRTFGEAPRPFFYFPLEASPAMATVLARFASPGRAAMEPIERAVRGIDPDLAVTGGGTLEQMTNASLLVPKAAVVVFGALGLIGLMLSAIGLFGVLAFNVSQRTHEIGLRMAIGASRADVLQLIVKRSLALTLSGLALGTLAALASTRFLQAMLYDVSATDALAFLFGTGLLLVVALFASLAPARAALDISPTEALRSD